MTKLNGLLLVPLLALAAPSLAHAGMPVAFDQLPAPVKATVERETKGSQIVEIEQETEAGVVEFEIEFIQNQTKFEIKVAPDGTLLERKLD